MLVSRCLPKDLPCHLYRCFQPSILPCHLRLHSRSRVRSELRSFSSSSPYRNSPESESHGSLSSEPLPPSPLGGTYQFIGRRRVLVKDGGIRQQIQAKEEAYLSEIDNAARVHENVTLDSMLNDIDKSLESVDSHDLSSFERDGAEETDDSIGGRQQLKIGDLVEIRSSTSSPTLGIYLRPSRSKGRAVDTLNVNGTIQPIVPNRVSFYIPGFTTADQLDPIIQYLDQMESFQSARGAPSGAESIVVPLKMTNHILEPAKEFLVSAQQARSGAYGMFSVLYNKLTSGKRGRAHVEVTLQAAAEMVFGAQYNLVQLYATHCALMADGTHFRANRGFHRQNPVFQIPTQEVVAGYDMVSSWIRESQLSSFQEKPAGNRKGGQAFKLFIEKARYLIDRSRQIRTSDPADPNILVEEVKRDMTFSWTDWLFIEYLKTYLASHSSQGTPIESLAPFIIRATQRYGDAALDNNTVYQFLSEIGVHTPWENPALYDEKQKLSKRSPTVNMEEKSPENILERDSMRSIRKDWGDLPVFTIDSASTREVDDGLSIEKVSEKESWIHIHIANPTAFLSPDEEIAKRAADRASTKYFYPHVVPMFSSSLGSALSVARDAPVMTFSAKLDHDSGEILDLDVQMGTVRKVRRLTYEQVTECLGGNRSAAPRFSLDIGNLPSPSTPPSSPERPDASEIADLKALHAAAIAFRKNRVRNGASVFSYPELFYSVDEGIATFKHHSAAPKPVLYRGNPAVRLRVNDPLPVATDSGVLVSELMLLASAVCARFAAKNGIPVPYRIYDFANAYPNAVDNYQHRLLPQRDEFGIVADGPRWIPTLRQMGGGALQTETGVHSLLGFNGHGHLKVTSPLRRYMDMMVHWNVQAHLGGQKMVFSEEQLKEKLPAIFFEERMATLGAKESQRFWGAFAIKRALELGLPLPKRLTMVVMDRGGAKRLDQNLGYCPELGMSGRLRLRSTRESTLVETGDVLEVAIGEVKLAETMVTFESMGIVEKVPAMFKIT